MSQVDPNGIIDRLKVVLNIETDRKLAKFLGVPQSSVSNWRNRSAIALPLIIATCAEHGLDLNEILLGRKNPWIVPPLIYFTPDDDTGMIEDKHVLSAERFPASIAANPDVLGVDPRRLETMRVEMDACPPGLKYGDMVIIRWLHPTDPLKERGIYFLIGARSLEDLPVGEGRFAQIIPRLQGGARVIFPDRAEAIIQEPRLTSDGVYGQVLAVLKSLSTIASVWY